MSDQTIFRTRQGLVENAAGRLVCPTCRSPKVWTPMLHGTTPYLSVSLDAAVPAVTAQARQRAEEGIGIEVDLRCANGHGFVLRLAVDLDGATVTTEWEEVEGA